MPPFTWDIFISYAHIDNKDPRGIRQGWIDSLHHGLDTRLAQLLGRQPRSWRDPTLAGNDILNDTIRDALVHTALFVAVLSPRYLESSSCREEMAHFARCAATQGGMQMGSTQRVFKVIKTEVALAEQPAEWQQLLGYEFYAKDSATGRVQEFDHLVAEKQYDPRFWSQFERLAQELKTILETLQQDAHLLLPTSKASGSTVYLAETTSDLSAERDNIRRELQQHGHRVLPDHTLPLNGPALEQAVREYLHEATLSIHLLGAPYGVIPEMERHRSSLHIQLDLAAERCPTPQFSRLIWIPPGLQTVDERQQALLATLQAGSHQGSELLRTKLEDVKTIILAQLAPKPQPPPNGHAEPALPSVYLICDKQDYPDTRPLEDFLFKQDINVLPSPFEGNETDMGRYHRESLQLCDAVMIYYGRASDTWVQLKRLELLKLAGAGRERPLRTKAFYLSAPTTAQKERFRCPDALVMRSYQDFDTVALESFVAQLRPARSTPG